MTDTSNNAIDGTKNPSQWVEDVNKTLDYLQDDVEKLTGANKRATIGVAAIGLGLAIQGFVVMQIMKSVRQISIVLSQALTPPPMSPEDEHRARVLLNEETAAPVRKPDILEDTEVKAQAGAPVEVGNAEVPDPVKSLLAKEDNSVIVEDTTPLTDKGDVGNAL